MSREHRVPWGALVPARRGWLRLVAAPSSALLVFGIVITAAAKLQVARGLAGVGWWPRHGLVAIAADVAWFLGAAALFAIAESRARWVWLATTPLALAMFAVAAGNAIYLWLSGEQLSWQVVSVGLERFGDVKGIVGEIAVGGPIAVAIAIIALVVGGAIAMLRRGGHSLQPGAEGVLRAHAAGLCAALAIAVVAVAPTPRSFALDRLRANAVIRIYAGLVRGTPWSGQYAFTAYTPAQLVDASAVPTARPNVVLVILESTGYHATSLAGQHALAHTPNLERIAGRGLEVTTTRAVIPHTTKSVWSILCGRLPLMQVELGELSDDVALQCLPAALGARGWRTGFFQSAIGEFEDRPRLVHRLGFADLATLEDIGGEQLGYLAGDDEQLVAPLARWIDAVPGEPFFATVLTSAAHHDYALSTAAADRARAERKPTDRDRDRHARLVEAEDHAVGRIVELLTARGLADRTIIVVVGDHGEGFGDKGVRQHDNNFFEEGLRVPWVIAGPGVPHRRVDTAASLVDVVPTLLELIGLPAIEAPPGRSVLREVPPGRVLPFSCWYDARCRGFVRDRVKVVFVPELDQAFWFDLARDPDERDPRGLTDELYAELVRVHAVLDDHRTDRSITRGPMTAYPAWTCPANEPCRRSRP